MAFTKLLKKFDAAIKSVAELRDEMKAMGLTNSWREAHVVYLDLCKGRRIVVAQIEMVKEGQNENDHA